MKVQLVSDIHLESSGIHLDYSQADVVVLAGDIGVGEQGLDWALSTIDKPVIYVLGNHEYYGEDHPSLVERLKHKARNTQVHILENDSVIIDDVTFYGCTMWTDFSLFSTPELSALDCQLRMNDYRMIKSRNAKAALTSTDILQCHRKSRHWLESQIGQCTTDKKVIVTHHAPSIQSIPVFKQQHKLSPGYASNLESLMTALKANLWLHGHVHYSSDYRRGDTNVVCNPRGYSHIDNYDFNNACIKDI